MKHEAKCKGCGAVYKFKGMKMPGAVKCFCNGTSFQNQK